MLGEALRQTDETPATVQMAHAQERQRAGERYSGTAVYQSS